MNNTRQYGGPPVLSDIGILVHQERHHVRVSLRDNEVVHIEQLCQAAHGEILMHAAIGPFHALWTETIIIIITKKTKAVIRKLNHENSEKLRFFFFSFFKGNKQETKKRYFLIVWDDVSMFVFAHELDGTVHSRNGTWRKSSWPYHLNENAWNRQKNETKKCDVRSIECMTGKYIIYIFCSSYHMWSREVI